MREALFLFERGLYLGGGGPIYALTSTEAVAVPVDAVLWLDDEGTA